MTYRLVIYPAAEADVDEAAEYMANDNPDAASRFYDAVAATYEQLISSPTRWPRYKLGIKRLANIRKRAVIGFRKYLVFYQLHGNRVEIVRVLYGARDIQTIFREQDDS